MLHPIEMVKQKYVVKCTRIVTLFNFKTMKLTNLIPIYMIIKTVKTEQF